MTADRYVPTSEDRFSGAAKDVLTHPEPVGINPEVGHEEMSGSARGPR